PASRLAAFAATHEFAHPFLAEPLGLVDDHLSPQEHLLHSPGDAMPLEKRVVHPTVPLRAADRPRLLGVEQDEVRLGADAHGALAWKEPEELGRRRCGQLHEAVQRQAVLPHTAVEDQGEPCLYPGRAVGNLAEIALALLLGAAHPPRLLVEAEGA